MIVASQWNLISKKVFSEFSSRSFFWQSVEAATRHAPWKKGVLKNSQEKTCTSLFLNKFAGPRPETLFKALLWHRCFPVSLWKVLWNVFHRTPRIRNVPWDIHQKCFMKKGAFKTVTIFTGIHFCCSLLPPGLQLC